MLCPCSTAPRSSRRRATSASVYMPAAIVADRSDGAHDGAPTRAACRCHPGQLWRPRGSGSAPARWGRGGFFTGPRSGRPLPQRLTPALPTPCRPAQHERPLAQRGVVGEVVDAVDHKPEQGAEGRRQRNRRRARYDEEGDAGPEQARTRQRPRASWARCRHRRGARSARVDRGRSSSSAVPARHRRAP